MSWLFSRALVAEYSVASYLDSGPFAPLKSTPTARAFLLRDKTTDTWSHFPSGMTCEPLTASHGEALLTWFLAGFRARTSAAQESAPASTEPAAASGASLRESSEKSAQLTLSLKIPRTCEPEGSRSYSATLPAWGMMRGGEWSALTPPELPISESGCGFELPTPTCAGNEMSPSMKKWPAHHRFATLMAKLYGNQRGGDRDEPGRADGRSSARLVARSWKCANG